MMGNLADEMDKLTLDMARKSGRVPLYQLQPSRWQPRSPVFDEEALWELAKSIRSNGLINPIVVFPVDGRFELVAGERRTRAMAGLALGEAYDNHTEMEYVKRLANVGLAGLNDREWLALRQSGRTIRATIKDLPTCDQEWIALHRMAVVENLERENLNPLEEARALAGLVEAYGWTQRDLAQRLGKSQGWVAQRLGLLELPPEAQEAVEASTLTLTHARSLQGMPKAVAPAVTASVARSVAAGATTREVDRLAQEVKSFLDPARYELEEGLRYPPQTRNRVAMLRWLVETADWSEHSDALLKLAKHGDLRDLRNMIGFRLERIVSAAGYTSVDAAWEAFAAANSRMCPNCRFSAYQWSGDEWEWQSWDPPCQRWIDAEAQTCDRYIGYKDPEVIELGYWIRNGFDALGLPYEREPFDHVSDLDRLVEDWSRVQAHYAATAAERQEKAQTHHITAIQRYYDWQQTLPMKALEHVQAHACAKCAYRVFGPEGPCYFCQEPLTDQRGRLQPPEFGALVMQSGLMLPRCEMFTYQQRLPIKRVEGTRLMNGEQVVDWLLQAADRQGNGYYNIWAILQWLDYGRMPGESERTQDIGRLRDHLLATWALPAATIEEEFPTLMDVALSEAHPISRGGGPVMNLVNPVTGAREQFVAIDFDVAIGADTWPHYRDYPENWPRPWLDAREAEDGNEPGD